MNQNKKLSHGAILIASPQLKNSHFHNAVVLILEHDQEGAVGIVLNRPSTIRCKQIAKQFKVNWKKQQEHLLIGGPVDTNSLWILHTDNCDFEHTRLFEGVSFSRSAKTLIGLCSSEEEDVRLFVGYAGWGAQQLEREIMEGSWWMSEADASLVFNTKVEDIWYDALGAMGLDACFLMDDSGYVH